MLKDKVALITGGSQGVGQGIALALAKQGAHVAVTGSILEKCETTASLLRDRGVNAMAHRCDVYIKEQTKGSLEVGKLADLVILSENPTTISPRGIKNIQVMETIKAGKTIFVAE